MFGLFKKKHKADYEIQQLITFVYSGSLVYAAKIISNFPNNYTEAELKSMYEKQDYLDLYGDYKKNFKVGFECAIAMLALVDRYFSAAEVRHEGDYIYKTISDAMIEKYTEHYRKFFDGTTNNISNMLIDIQNLRNNQYYKLALEITENASLASTLPFSVAKNIYKIKMDLEDENFDYLNAEFERVIKHTMETIYDNDFRNLLAHVKQKLLS